MQTPALFMTTIGLVFFLVTKSTAQNAKDIRGPSPLIAIENEAPAKLIVDSPLPERLAAGRVFIPSFSTAPRTFGWCLFGKGGAWSVASNWSYSHHRG